MCAYLQFDIFQGALPTELNQQISQQYIASDMRLEFHTLPIYIGKSTFSCARNYNFIYFKEPCQHN
jgi:hypothetical protein